MESFFDKIMRCKLTRLWWVNHKCSIQVGFKSEDDTFGTGLSSTGIAWKWRVRGTFAAVLTAAAGSDASSCSPPSCFKFSRGRRHTPLHAHVTPQPQQRWVNPQERHKATTYFEIVGCFHRKRYTVFQQEVISEMSLAFITNQL